MSHVENLIRDERIAKLEKKVSELEAKEVWKAGRAAGYEAGYKDRLNK